MSPNGVTEPVDVSGDGFFSLLVGLPVDQPNPLGLEGLEGRLDHRVVVTVPAPAHLDQDAAFAATGSRQRSIVIHDPNDEHALGRGCDVRCSPFL